MSAVTCDALTLPPSQARHAEIIHHCLTKFVTQRVEATNERSRAHFFVFRSFHNVIFNIYFSGCNTESVIGIFIDRAVRKIFCSLHLIFKYWPRRNDLNRILRDTLATHYKTFLLFDQRFLTVRVPFECFSMIVAAVYPERNIQTTSAFLKKWENSACFFAWINFVFVHDWSSKTVL